MAALQTLKRPSVDEVPAERSSADFGPIHFLYTFLHESIRRELELLASLLTPPAEGCSPNWAELQRRYAFLRDVYKYHSSAEDEVRGYRASQCCMCYWHLLVCMLDRSCLMPVWLSRSSTLPLRPR